MNDLLLSEQRYNVDKIFRYIISIIGLILFLWVLNLLKDVLLPFAIAFVLAYLVHPIVSKIQTKVRNRAAALAITVLGFIVLLSAIALLLFPIIANQMVYTWQILRTVIIESDLPASIQAYIPAGVLEQFQTTLQNGELQQVLQSGDVLGAAQSIASYLFPSIFSTLSGLLGILSAIGIVVVIALYTFFLLLDFDGEKQEWSALLPPQYRTPVIHFLKDVNAAMQTYFRGQFVVSLGTGICLAIGFMIIGLPLAIPLGITIGLLNMVPYLALAGLIPTLFLQVVQAIGTNQSVGYAVLGVLIVFMVAQLIQDGILTPKILGESTGLSPVFILLALSIWGKLLGLLGLIIAIPITCVLLASYRQFLAAKAEQPKRSTHKKTKKKA